VLDLNKQLASVSMTNVPDLHAQFITDSEGRKTAVILPIEEYDELLEDMADLAAIAERRDEPTIPHDRVVEELKRDGTLSD
jgi:hypothetical protein